MMSKHKAHPVKLLQIQHSIPFSQSVVLYRMFKFLVVLKQKSFGK